MDFCFYLFDFGHVSDKSVIVNELEDFLQLVQISEEVVSDSLHKQENVKDETSF